MSTNCSISLQVKKGDIKTIYCHLDGYLEGVGKCLKTFYNNEEKIQKLIELGDLSFLGESPISNPILWDSNLKIEEFDALSKKYCRSYRDRGDDNIDYRSYKSIKDMLDNECQEFNYIFVNGNWYYLQNGRKYLV